MVAEKQKAGVLGTGLYEVKIQSKWVSQTCRCMTPYYELSVCKHKLQDCDGSSPLLSQ